MDQLLRLLTLQDANTRVVLLGATVLGIASAVVGSFAVLRKRSLVGDAVAHAALPGVCLAYFVVGEKHFAAFLIGATLMGVLAAAFVAAVKALTRIKEDAAIAISIGGFFGLGIVLSRIIQNQPQGSAAGLDGFIFGKAASMGSHDAQLILAVAVAVVVLTALFYKEFKLLCFDRDFAAGQGWPTFLLDLLLMGLVCVCTVVGLPAVGVVLMVALLVIPAVAARFWTNRLGVMVLLAAIFGGASGFLGTVLSASVPVPGGSLSRGWPTGPLIVLVASLLFGVSLLCAPRRGLLADVVRRLSLRRRIALQNLLRDAYESLEARSDFAAPWLPRQVARDAQVSARVLGRATAQGLIAPTSGGYVLTRDGQLAAARIVRAHRLWEQYLIEQADIAVDHVDRDADQIEHILPPGVIAQLEERLAMEGRLPELAASLAVPASPHPIETAARPMGRTGREADVVGADAGSGVTTRVPNAGAGRGTLGMFLLAGALMLGVVPARDTYASNVDSTASSTFVCAASPTIVPSQIEPTVDSGDRTNDAWFTLRGYEVRDEDLSTVGTAVLCSVACGVIGCFLVLRRMSLLGDAISHAILPGLALAFMVTSSREPLTMLVGAMIVGVLTAVLSSGLNRWGKVPEDASMGVVFTTLFALGVILITLVASDVDLDPGCVLYGLIEFVPFDTVSIAGAQVPRAFLWLAAALLVNVTLITVFYKELKIVCFDPHLATSMGISAALVHYGLMTGVAATSVASFEAVGSILVIAMLVAPGATAHLLTDRLSRMLWWSAAIAAVCAVTGYVLAVRFNTSVAGMIATVSLVIFILTAVVSPRYGVLTRAFVRRSIPTPD